MRYPAPNETPEQILEIIYGAVKEGLIESAMDLLYDYADRSYWAGQFINMDRMFALADLDKLGSYLVIGLLVTGHWARPDLKNREWLVTRAEKWYKVKGESEERIQRLLQGLR